MRKFYETDNTCLPAKLNLHSILKLSMSCVIKNKFAIVSKHLFLDRKERAEREWEEGRRKEKKRERIKLSWHFIIIIFSYDLMFRNTQVN